MKIGHYLKDLRIIKLGISQKNFAEKIGISKAYLNLIENDKKQPSIELLTKIAELYDIPVQMLIFLSLSEDDVKENRKLAYRITKPAIDDLIMSFSSVRFI